MKRNVPERCLCTSRVGNGMLQTLIKIGAKGHQETSRQSVYPAHMDCIPKKVIAYPDSCRAGRKSISEHSSSEK